MRVRIQLVTCFVLLILSLALFTFNAHAEEELGFDIDEDGEAGVRRLDYEKGRQGTGVLYAYITDFTDEVEQNPAGNYLVYPGGNYDFRIENITEYKNTNITVWTSYQINDTTYNIEIKTFQIGLNPKNVTFQWTVPSDLPITTSIKFKYGTNYQGPVGTWVYTCKDIRPSPRLLLVVPETFLGSLGAIAALFAGLKIKSFVRKKE